MSIKISHDDFINKISKINPNIQILDKYEKAIIPVKVLCKKCGHVWCARPNNLNHRTSCPKCCGNQKKTHEKFISEMSLLNPDMEILGEYIHSHCNIEVRCKIHDYTYISQPTTLLGGGGCKYCGLEKTVQKKKDKGFERLKFMFAKANLILLNTREEYISRSEVLLKYLCPIHGLVEDDTAVNFVARKGSCIKCSQEREYNYQRKYSKESLENLLLSKGLELASAIEGNITLATMVEFICTNHTEEGVQTRNILAIQNSKTCCKKGASELLGEINRTVTIDDVSKICTEKGYKLLTDYISSMDDTVKYICSLHEHYGVQTTSLYNLRKNENNCKLCSSLRGEDHPNYCGGISTERDRVKHADEYIEWRNKVFKRDNFTCQCCGNAKIKLNAHHIKNFANCVEHRFSIDNGITLCENCHSIGVYGSFHNIYWTKYNTKEQLDEYISLRKQNVPLEQIRLIAKCNKGAAFTTPPPYQQSIPSQTPLLYLSTSHCNS